LILAAMQIEARMRRHRESGRVEVRRGQGAPRRLQDGLEGQGSKCVPEGESFASAGPEQALREVLAKVPGDRDSTRLACESARRLAKKRSRAARYAS
jgi:hypothetical protein